MAEDISQEGTQAMKDSGSSFLLFLILILLLLGNQNTFGSYFELFDKKIVKINNLLKAFSVTAEGLKGAFNAPQKLMREFYK